MKQILAFSILLVLVDTSCEKEKLENGKAILIGNWEWIYSIKRTKDNSPPFGSYEEVILPSSTTNKYEIEFLEKGKVKYIENGKVVDKYRIVFFKFDGIGSCNVHLQNAHDFIIGLTMILKIVSRVALTRIH